MKACFAIGMLAVFLSACSNKIRVSNYAKFNKINNSFFQTFSNDSLELAIDFFGRSSYTSFGNKNKYSVPKNDIAVLKKLGIRKKAIILLYLKPNVKKWQQESYGYIVDKSFFKTNSSLMAFDTTKSGEDYFVIKDLYRNKNKKTTSVGGAEIGNKFFILIESQNTSALEFWDSSDHVKNWDSLNQIGNTSWQLSSVLKGEKGMRFLAARKKVNNAMDSSLKLKNYVAAINGLKAIPKDTVEYYKLDNFYFQDLVTRISYFDDLDSIHTAYEDYRSPSTTINPNNKFSLSGDAINAVSKIAKTQKMLMINESHYDYRQRLFVYLLLDSLYKSGYRNLCLETLTRGSDFRTIDKEKGFYIAEPFYALLARKAEQIGFDVYAYDTSASSIIERESGQAQNLFDLYSKDTEHKWVVLAGYSHINKKGFSGESPSALQFFTKLAGFAPYSINQSLFSDITDQRYIVPGNTVGYYAVDTSSFVYKKDGQSDLYIINNIKQHPFEKPFAAIQPYLQTYKIDLSPNITSNKNIMIFIRKEWDQLHDEAIPVYMSLAKKDQTKNLQLPPGNYVGILVNNNGRVASEFAVINQSLHVTFSAKKNLPAINKN